MPGLHIGLTGSRDATVTADMLASNVGSGTVAVFSTAMLVALLEGTAVNLVQELLDDGQTTVGTAINITHIAATPQDMEVHFFAELTGISANGKGLTFKVWARDAVDTIAEGSHQRVIVNKKTFEAKTVAKGQRSRQG